MQRELTRQQLSLLKPMEEAIALLSWLRESSASNFKAPSKQDVIFFCQVMIRHISANIGTYKLYHLPEISNYSDTFGNTNDCPTAKSSMFISAVTK